MDVSWALHGKAKDWKSSIRKEPFLGERETNPSQPSGFTKEQKEEIRQLLLECRSSSHQKITKEGKNSEMFSGLTAQSGNLLVALIVNRGSGVWVVDSGG